MYHRVHSRVLPIHSELEDKTLKTGSSLPVHFFRYFLMLYDVSLSYVPTVDQINSIRPDQGSGTGLASGRGGRHRLGFLHDYF